MNPGPFLLESAIRLAALVALTTATLAMLRVRSASVQLRVWSGVALLGLVWPALPQFWTVDVVVPTGTAVSTAWSVVSGPSGPPAVTGTMTVLLTSLYVVGACVLLLRLALGWRAANHLWHSGHFVAAEAFFESNAVTVPVTVGVWSPRVLLPVSWRGWSRETLRDVLAHERAHARRRDSLWLAVAHLHRALHWFNPLSWWLTSHLTSLAERASDDAALEGGASTTDYASVLLGFASTVSTSRRRLRATAAVLPMAHVSGRALSRRIDRVLTWKGSDPMAPVRIVLVVTVLAAASAVSYAASPMPMPISIAAPASTGAPVEVPAIKVPPVALPAVTAPRQERSKTTPPKKQDDTKPVATEPVLERSVSPKYTPEAMRAKIEGVVELSVDINPDGVVTGARVARSLDTVYGLDGQAIDAAMLWRFKPATVNGAPVATSVAISMEFRLHRF